MLSFLKEYLRYEFIYVEHLAWKSDVDLIQSLSFGGLKLDLLFD